MLNSLKKKILGNWQVIFLAVMILLFFAVGLKRGVLVTTGNDFSWHLKSGQDALKSASGIVISEPMQSHYTPGRIAFNAVLSYFPEQTAKAIVFFFAYFAFILSLYLWNSIADNCGAGYSRKGVLLANALSYLLMVFYIIRDLDDCGLQLLLFSLLLISAWLLFKGYRITSGLMLALAVTWKSAPLLFLPFLLYKRQWKASLALIIGIIVFNTLPSLMLFGSVETEKQWVRIGSMFQLSILGKLPENHEELKSIVTFNTGPAYNLKDPRRNAVEIARNQNQALKPALGRYLLRSDQSDSLFITSEGHWQNNGRIGDSMPELDAPEHPLWLQFLDLPVELGGRVATGIILLLGLCIAWRFRRAWRTENRDNNKTGICDENFPAEWSVACIFTALLSPLCWLHHLVLLLPAVILIMREAVHYRWAWGLWRWCCFGFLLLPAWVTERDFIGKELAIIALSYKFHTMAALLLVLLVLTLKDRGRVGTAAES